MRISFLLVLFCDHAQAKGGNKMLEDFAISPDGRTVAFQYVDKGSKRHGLGLLEWESGKLTPISSPKGTDIGGNPRFSYDGKRLVAMMSDSTSGQIVSIDIISQKLTLLARAGRGWNTPVFQPGTDNVLFVDGGPSVRPGGHYYLKLLNLLDHTEQTVVEEKDGFRAIFHPSFVSQSEIIFQARSPADTKLVQEVVDLVKRPGANRSADLVYRLSIGARPEIILKEITSHSARDVDSTVVKFNPRITSVSASRDGKAIVFIDLSSLTPHTKGAGYNYELFKLENGKLTQMTQLLSLLHVARISYDGSTVAFGKIPERRVQDLDLFILNVLTGEVRSTHLLEKLAERPDFNLP